METAEDSPTPPPAKAKAEKKNKRKSPKTPKLSFQDIIEVVGQEEDQPEQPDVKQEEDDDDDEQEEEEVVTDLPPPKKRKKRASKQLDASIVVVKITEDSPKVITNPFPCNLCSKAYTRKDRLKIHLAEKHQCFNVPIPTVVSEYVCSYCDKSYKTLQTFDRHLLGHESHPFRCFICTEAFPTRGELRIHRYKCLNLTCVGDGQYQCVSCTDSEYFDNVDDLRLHMSTCNVDEAGQYICSTCGELFKRAHHLQLHMERVHNERVNCLKCPKTFETRALLKKHFDRCHNYMGKPLECVECGRRLSRPDKLIEHMRLHTGYTCNLCDCVLVTRKEYKEHRKEHEELEG